MASGLGAIILVLILVKQDVDKAPAPPDLLQADLARLQQQDMRLQQSLSTARQGAEDSIAQTARMQSDIAALRVEIVQQSDAVKQQQSALSSIKNINKPAPAAHNSDVVQNERGNEENYIMGLRVEGRRILFLIDSSASMTDERLIDIIRRKNSADSSKKKGPKWLRSKRIVRWLLARAPTDSRVAVVAYGSKATILGSGGWFSSSDGASVKKVYSDLDKLTPTGATNLQRGLQAATALRPTDIYLLTDGLPTAGQSRFASLNPFSACGGLLGRSSTISGACRVKLFRQTLAESAPGGTKVNVILLPIEGDPQAAPQYWAWTAKTGGLLIAPAASWP